MTVPCAAAMASFALAKRRHLDFPVDSTYRFFQIQIQGETQIRPALARLLPVATATAEDIAEDIAEDVADITLKTARTSRATL